MLEVKSIPIVGTAVEHIKSIRQRKLKPASEHPDLRMIRRHRAAEAAIKNLDQFKNKGNYYR